MRNASRIAHRPLYSPPCWTKAFITVRFARCTGSWQKRVKLGSVAIRLTHPPYRKPELLAAAPNQLWSWNITKLKGPAKWTYFYLYVILDVFSR